MYNNKKIIPTYGLLCTAMFFLNVAEAHAAKAHHKQLKRDVQVKSSTAKPPKRNRQPPDLWVTLRTRLSLPKPLPVHWPTATISPPVLHQGERQHKGQGSVINANLQPMAVEPDSHGANPMKGADIQPVSLGISVRNYGTPFGTSAPGSAKSGEQQPEGPPAGDDNLDLAADEARSREFDELKRQESIYSRYSNQVQWFSRRMGFIRQSVERATPYLYLIMDDLEAYKLPLDLALLPILESGYEPGAVSPKAATGIWQFMSATATEYGLAQGDWYDGRLDIAASTRAAVRFLSHLSKKFHGDWLLALAAYNCGERRVEQAMAANQAADLPTDFWSLRLPEETMAYVPRLLALSTIFSNPAVYGLTLKPTSYRPNLVKVRFERRMTVAEVSRLAGLSTREFTHLNPGFIKDTVAVDGPSELLLPEHKRAEFQGRLEVAALTDAAPEPLLLAKNDQKQFCAAYPLLE